jgi:hypothetical protein
MGKCDISLSRDLHFIGRRRRRIKLSKFKHGGIIIETRGGNSNFDVILLISMRNK